MVFDNNIKLGFGLMRLPVTDPDDSATIDVETMKKMADEFIHAGGTYFDTAWVYHKCTSENAVKEVLTDRYPRNSFTIATKIHASSYNSEKERQDIFDAQLKKMGVDYIDYYLLHALNRSNYEKCEKFDSFGWARSLKEKGLVRHIGFSYHDDAVLLDEILTAHPEIEFVQLQLNYLDWDSPEVQSRLCYEACVRHKRPVIVMEPVKGGTLHGMTGEAAQCLKASHPEWSQASWALRFAMSLKNVKVVLSGMSDEAQMKDNVRTALDFKPLNENEKETLEKVVRILNRKPQIPCTGCEYCAPGCPAGIPIPKYFSVYNADIQQEDVEGWKPQISYYNNLTEHFGAPEDCLQCGQCEQVCPQQLPIIENLKTLREHFAEQS